MQAATNFHPLRCALGLPKIFLLARKLHTHRGTDCTRKQHSVGSNVIREMDVGRDQKYYLAEAGSETFRAQLICENCDSIVEVEAPFMEWYGKAVAAKHGMRPISQKLQVTALCERCQKRKAARP